MRSQIPKHAVESIRLAARKLSSYRRREYQAEMALKYWLPRCWLISFYAVNGYNKGLTSKNKFQL